MIPLRVLPIKTETFGLLVRRLKRQLNDADVFEIDIDFMRVKGDLAVIQRYFEKPMIAKSTSLDLLRRGVKAGMHYAEMPWNLETDLEFTTLVNNKGAKMIYICESIDELTEEVKKKADFFRVGEKILRADGSEFAFLDHSL